MSATKQQQASRLSLPSRTTPPCPAVVVLCVAVPVCMGLGLRFLVGGGGRWWEGPLVVSHLRQQGSWASCHRARSGQSLCWTPADRAGGALRASGLQQHVILPLPLLHCPVDLLLQHCHER